MLKREKARIELLERSPNSGNDRPKPVVGPPLKKEDASKIWKSMKDMIRQPTNQPLQRESSSALILDAIVQKLASPKGRDRRSLNPTKPSLSELIKDPVVQFSSAGKDEYAKLIEDPVVQLSSAGKDEYAKETCKISCDAALHAPLAAVQKSTSLETLECRFDHVDDTIKSILSELQTMKTMLIAL